jgi:ParB-like chromosome segregation protein Spo0J
MKKATYVRDQSKFIEKGGWATMPRSPEPNSAVARACADSNIIAGHGRVLAAKQLGLTEIPVRVARGWSAAQKRAYVIADNKLTENGGWDDDLLKVEIGALQGEGFDLTLTGFSAMEIGQLLGDVMVTDDIEAAPESKYKEQFGVIVICKDEAHQQEVFESLAGSGYEVRVVVP